MHYVKLALVHVGIPLALIAAYHNGFVNWIPVLAGPKK